jgi:hypothetical protein
MAVQLGMVWNAGSGGAHWSGIVGELLVIVIAVAAFEGVWIWLDRQERRDRTMPVTKHLNAVPNDVVPADHGPMDPHRPPAVLVDPEEPEELSA